MINVKISKKVFNDKYIPLLDDDTRYIVMYGGGSSGKSYFIVERYVKKIMQQKQNNTFTSNKITLKRECDFKSNIGL